MGTIPMQMYCLRPRRLKARTFKVPTAERFLDDALAKRDGLAFLTLSIFDKRWLRLFDFFGLDTMMKSLFAVEEREGCFDEAGLKE